MKGVAHIGVLKALEEDGIKCDFIAGSSAGSIVAALYACGMRPRQMADVILGLRRKDYLDPNWEAFFALFNPCAPRGLVMPEGLLKGNKIKGLIHRWAQGKKLQDVKLPLAIVATDIDTGKRVVFTNCHLEIEDEDTLVITEAYLSEAVRASTAIPLVFCPYYMGKLRLLDGGLKDILPVALVKAMGARYVLGVDLRPDSFAGPAEDPLAIIERSIDIMVRETSQAEVMEYADLVVRLSLEPIGLGQIEKAKKLISVGYKEMKEHMEVLKSGLYKSSR